MKAHKMESAQMRDFSEFCEQLNEIRVRFQKWDSCERTVAMYYLMVGLPFANAKFLHHALEQCIMAVATPESQILQHNANDPGFIMGTILEAPQNALQTLLTHLPLLQPGNKEAATCYLVTIRKIFADLMVPPYKIYNECVEIMSYVFIHPAFDKEEKKSFRQLLKQIVNRVTPENFIHSPVNESSDDSASPNPEPMTNLQDKNRMNRRSNSLTPGQTSSHENLAPAMELWSSQENLTQQGTKPRSYSLSSDKTINLQSHNLQSSSSETRLQDLHTQNNMPIMKSIVSWLKSLRLHKYSWVFNNLNYEQMLKLTDESLQAIGITKGARHKLLLSIAKLEERSTLLTELETEVMNGGDLLNALKKLKGVLQSPLLVSNGEDLPSQFVKVMGKVCTQLLMLRQPTDECLMLFSTLWERADASDAFSSEQKRRLTLWRSQLLRGNHSNSYNHVQTNNNFNKHPPTTNTFNPIPGPSLQHVFNHKSSSYPNMQANQVIGGHRHSVGSVQLSKILQAQPIGKTTTTSSTTAAFNYNAADTQPHHVRFKDPEPEKTVKSSQPISNIMKNVDIESSLESLCLQMMEHALGP